MVSINFDPESCIAQPHQGAPVRTAIVRWCAAALGFAFLLWLALANQTTDASTDCRALSDSGARLACYDRAAHTQPAKGANVPAEIFNRSGR